jgi:hypothetical protein
MTVDKPEQEFVIPTIDIAPYLEDPDSKQSVKIIDEVRKACSTCFRLKRISFLSLSWQSRKHGRVATHGLRHVVSRDL